MISSASAASSTGAQRKHADEDGVPLHLVVCIEVADAPEQHACMHAEVSLDAGLGVNDSLAVQVTNTLRLVVELVDVYLTPSVTYLVTRALDKATASEIKVMEQAGWAPGSVALNASHRMIGVVLPPPARVIIASQGWSQDHSHNGQWLRDVGVLPTPPCARPVFLKTPNARDVTDLRAWSQRRRKPASL
jgi:hypothetical protein